MSILDNQNINNDMKELLDNMQQTQKDIQNIVVVGEAGGGLVKVTMNGLHETIKVQISPAAIDDDPKVLADLILSANNDAAKKLESALKNKMLDIAKNMKLPEGLVPPGEIGGSSDVEGSDG